MNVSTRGAASVSIVWIIAAGVLVLVALAFGFVQSSDLGQARSDLATAAADRAAADASLDELRVELRQVSEAVGWYDRESANPRTNVEALRQGLADLKGVFSDLGDDISDLERAVPVVVAAYNQRGQQVTDLRNEAKVKQGEIDAAREGERAVASGKDDELSQLRSEMADAADTAQSRIDELERRVDQLSSQNSDLDLELRRERQQVADAARAHAKELARYRTRLSQLSDTLAFTRPDNADQPDGKVLVVSDKMSIGFIDLGTRHRVSRGMRFQVRSASHDAKGIKAWAEVTEAGADTSQVRFSDLTDKFNPVVEGDVLVNELYDRDGGRNAVLVGRFDSTYNRNELGLLLKDIGINVQSRLDSTTHYLIVGSEIWTDEDGEPLEEPLQPSDLPIYKEAESLGVHIVPLQNVREFFTVQRRG